MAVKIFYFIPNLQQGGPERQILSLISRLPSRYQPILCVYHSDNIFYDAECPPGQPAYSLGTRRMGLRSLRQLTDILRDENPVIVHSYRDKSNFWARWAARRASVPIVITSCRNRMMNLRYLLIERLLSRYTNIILTNSIGVVQELTHIARVPNDKIKVIYNILDTDRFRPPSAEERRQARLQWSIGAGDRVLLLPGRIGLQKNQIGTLLALRTLAAEGALNSQLVLLFAGRERDQLASAVSHWLADDPRIRGNIRFLGAQKDIRSLYWASDVLVMPSLYEGLANAALEGCASGLPAILSRAANVDGIIEPGVSGWEVPTLGHSGLVTALRSALGAGAGELAAMGAAARARVSQRFAPYDNVVVDQTVAVYDQLVEEMKTNGRAN
ncbi:MAG TPA: glycosyltransferase family 4 protein [Polyangia bacterium]|nr:glycosyltransferase family 4 protein [Polyangia bacterium]